MRHSHSYNLCAHFLELKHFVVQLNALYAMRVYVIANQRFQFTSSFQNSRWKTTVNPLKLKFEEIENKTLVLGDFLSLRKNMAMFRVLRYAICRWNNGNNGIMGTWCHLCDKNGFSNRGWTWSVKYFLVLHFFQIMTKFR